MGCASSKPSSSSKDKHKKNIKSKTKSNEQPNDTNGNLNNSIHKQNGVESSPIKTSKNIQLSQNLIDQIDEDNQRVINYISHIVHGDLNAELIGTQNHQSGNMASVVLAAAVARDNDDLIQDVASKAVYLITNKNPNYKPSTYKDLNDSLKAAQYLFKNQTNKNRIIDLTVDTIETSIDVINHEIEAQKDRFKLVDFLNKNQPETEQQLTPPQTPENKQVQPNQSTPNIDWDSAQLLSRAEANEVARILFLSNKARPVVHASPKAQDAYIVNKQVDNTEVMLTKDEIDEILNRNDEQPKFIELIDSINLSPITPQFSLHNRNFDDTPQLSCFANKNLAENLNELSDNSNEEIKNEEFTNVTPDDTIQFVSQEEGLEANEIKVEYLPGAVNTNQNEQSDNSVSIETRSSSDRKSIIYETTTIISKTTFIATPVDAESNLDKGNLDPTLKQSLLDDRFYNNDSFKTEAPVNGEKENEAAKKIQAAYRGHETRQESLSPDELYDNVITSDESEKAAIKIQATFRGFKTRKDLHKKDDDNTKNDDLDDLLK